MNDRQLPRLASVVLAASPGDLPDELDAIRVRRPSLVWFGVNGPRVDMVVREGADEWRIVYVTRDDVTFDWVEVFRKPPLLDGARPGVVVVVNGPSGAGKSSVLTALAEASAEPWVLFDEPVLGHVAQPYLIWREQAPDLHRGFLEGIGALARSGNRVGVAAAGHPHSAFDAACAGVAVVRVGLDCDVDTLIAREQGRDGRWGGLAESSVHVHDGWTYDLRFDTTQLSAAEIAGRVLERVTGIEPA